MLITLEEYFSTYLSTNWIIVSLCVAIIYSVINLVVKTCAPTLFASGEKTEKLGVYLVCDGLEILWPVLELHVVHIHHQETVPV